MPHVDALAIPASVRAVVREDGAILMDTNSGLMFSLNEVGRLIWEQLSSRADPRDISASLVQRYCISLEDAQRDVDAFLLELESSGLVICG